MNYYMNVAPLYERSDLGRRLYQEIGMIEEEHVSQYESLKDPTPTWLEDLLMHEYTECYLYYSCMMTECDLSVKRIWEECFMQELFHLHIAKDMLLKYEGKGNDYRFEVAPNPLPELQNRCSDNTSLARVPAATPDCTQICGTTKGCCKCVTATENGPVTF